MSTIEIIVCMAVLFAIIVALVNIFAYAFDKHQDVLIWKKELEEKIDREQELRLAYSRDISALEETSKKHHGYLKHLFHELEKLKEFTGMDKKEKVEEAAQNLLAEGSG